MMDENLVGIIKRTQEGEETAFNELYELYYRQAFFIALRICNCEADAYDAAQETFIEIQRSIVKLRDPTYFKLWFNRIVTSKCSNIFRKNKEVALPDDHYVFQEAYQEERIYLLPEANLKHSSDKDVLDAFIHCLDLRYREVLVLYYYGGLNMSEVAKVMNIPEGTAKSRMNTAKKDLRAMVKAYEQKEDIKLNFKVSKLSSIASALCMSEAMEYPALPKIRKIGNQIWSGGITKLALVATLSIATGSTVMAAYFGIQNYHKQQALKDQSITDKIVPETNLNPFSPVVFQNQTYSTAYDAYYELRIFAHCNEEMKQMSSQELLQMQEVYESLKEYQGVYWDLLVENGWSASYESLIY